MADWPMVADTGRAAGAGQVAATSTSVNIQTGTSNNTKGSWVQLVASSAVDADWIALEFGLFENVAGVDYLFDIGIGGAGSETVLIDNIAVGTRGTFVTPAMPLLPVSIPAGTRISARCQASNASVSGRATKLAVGLFDSGFAQSSALSRVVTMGANTADSGGVSIDPGAVANTKGSWTEISSSVATSSRWLLAAFANQANSARTTCSWLVDIGLGAAASEQVLIPDLLVTALASSTTFPALVSLPCSLPAGERLSVRAQCDITDATDRLFDFVAYGVS